MLEFLQFVPVVALLATIICIPLLASEMPGTEAERQRAARRAMRAPPRGATVPYISMRERYRDQ